ncbi:LysR family transcriptional regulator substrate-binding protein [Actinomadura sp. LOL_016]|uniref:LysR family transcriptional regulator substrate-binding protein n=1 Tax=unclassified Actinomadura TaxID=2626254 RepID=UPI003A80DE10
MAIAGLRDREPQAEVPLREGVSARLLTSVARGRLDVAVVARPPRAPGVEVIPLMDDPLLVAVPLDHALAGRTSVTAEMLQGERWIAASTDPGSTLLGAWTDSARRPEVAFVARDWIAKLGLVAAGLGVTVVPGVAVPALPPTIAVARIDHPAAVRATAVAHRPDGRNDRLRRAFVEALRGRVRRTVCRTETQAALDVLGHDPGDSRVTGGLPPRARVGACGVEVLEPVVKGVAVSGNGAAPATRSSTASTERSTRSTSAASWRPPSTRTASRWRSVSARIHDEPRQYRVVNPWMVLGPTSGALALARTLADTHAGYQGDWLVGLRVTGMNGAWAYETVREGIRIWSDPTPVRFRNRLIACEPSPVVRR